MTILFGTFGSLSMSVWVIKTMGIFRLRNWLFWGMLLLVFQGMGQYTFSGKVTDSETGNAIPFANIYLKGTTIGTTTDFDGHYHFQSSRLTDSITASYIGYEKRAKKVSTTKNQVVNFQLAPASTHLDVIEVVAVDRENPAWRIVRELMDHKKQHNPNSLESYNHESYTKLEFDAFNLTDRFKKRISALPGVRKVLDSLKLMAGDDGKMILPVYISESISRLYIQNEPQKKKEIVEASKISGIGMDDGSFLSQLAGASQQQYNFYQNYLSILRRDFISPLNSAWKIYYDYYLVDSMEIEGRFCYKIEIEPKRDQDLAFTGTIWVDKEDYALKRLDLSMSEKANMNYIEKIKIQQQFVKTEEGVWMVEKTRVLMEIEKLDEDMVGMIAKFYTSSKDFHLNEEHEPGFYYEPVELAEGALDYEEDYWEQQRHDTLSHTELAVYGMVDSIRNLPLVKTYIDVVETIVNGYYEMGKLDIGPYLFLYTYNDVEGHRIRLGGRTNLNFSRKMELKGYAAYGLKDKRFKYMARGRYIFNRRPWTELEVQTNKDIVQLGLIEEKITDDNLFMAFSNYGRLRQPFIYNQHHVYFQTDLVKGYTQSMKLMSKGYEALYPFAYTDEKGAVQQRIQISEVELTGRYAYGERYLLNDNSKFILDHSAFPVLTFSYAHGFKDVLNSGFEYDRYTVNLKHRLAVGAIGISKYSVTAGKVVGTLPYPLLKVHLGNETVFHNQLSFNLMNYFEFVSDQYVAVLYQHFFMGNLMNRIPLMRRLKWRALAETNILYGTLASQNMAIIPSVTPDGEPIAGFSSLDPYKPYVEIGYGLENVFRLLRIEAFHRLTYYNRPNANRFGIRVAMQFEL